MCVIAWSWQEHPEYPLVVIGNRDELHGRLAEPARWWADAPHVLAGRDVEGGGTWLGVTSGGRFATVTNRRPGQRPQGAPSRGGLAAGFLRSGADASSAVGTIAEAAELYAGFNLLLADTAALFFVSNRESKRDLARGTYGMANGSLDEPVPKVQRLTRALATWSGSGAPPNPSQWLDWLSDDEALDGGNPLSAIFVQGDRYGTRASSVVVFAADGSVSFVERRFHAGGQRAGESRFEFKVTS